MTRQEIIERSDDGAAVDTYISNMATRPRRGVKTSGRELEEYILALLGEHGEMSIGHLHRSLLEVVGVSYGLVQLTVKEMVQAGKLGKIEGWPRRYYRQAAADAAPVKQSTSPREMVTATLGRGRRPRSEMGRHGQEDDLGELEVEVLTVARELGPCILSDLHTALIQRRSVTYSTMLGAVRNLVSHRYLRRRQREDSRYIYEALDDEHN